LQVIVLSKKFFFSIPLVEFRLLFFLRCPTLGFFFFSAPPPGNKNPPRFFRSVCVLVGTKHIFFRHGFFFNPVCPTPLTQGLLLKTGGAVPFFFDNFNRHKVPPPPYLRVVPLFYLYVQAVSRPRFRREHNNKQLSPPPPPKTNFFFFHKKAPPGARLENHPGPCFFLWGGGFGVPVFQQPLFGGNQVLLG